ncbi:helical backbone metal receptor [Streptomyces sp. NPDC053755]|uniref:helical backbone metal receptor n=1 Tax=Streptomyces sp. NPDC053755 TaxID=3155815 RepID=UPI003435B106
MSAAVSRGARRVVSLVPSLTEAVAVTAPGLLVGATDWCTHPADLDVVRVGGTKNPDVPAIAALRPDLVIANEEENRAPDLAALRAAGIDVLVTEIRTLDQAFVELDRVLRACGVATRPRWLDEAEAAWAAVGAHVPPVDPVDLSAEDPLDLPAGDPAGTAAPAVGAAEPATAAAAAAAEGREATVGPAPAAVVPIWRRPWMVLGRDTFAGDLLARLGIRQLYADHAERYPRVPLDELCAAGADLVVLPDEPYRFTPDDGPEAFPAIPAALVSGRHLTWYGPSLAEAPAVLGRALRAARR